MAENEKVTIEIETKAKLDGIKKTQDSVENLSETVQESKGIFKDFIEKLKEGLKDPYVAWQNLNNLFKVGVATFKQGINFIAEGIKGYLDGERAVNRLTESYKALGIESFQAIKNAKDFAMEMRNATGITDDAFIDAQRLMANYGIVGQKAQEAIRAAYA